MFEFNSPYSLWKYSHSYVFAHKTKICHYMRECNSSKGAEVVELKDRILFGLKWCQHLMMFERLGELWDWAHYQRINVRSMLSKESMLKRENNDYQISSHTPDSSIGRSNVYLGCHWRKTIDSLYRNGKTTCCSFRWLPLITACRCLCAPRRGTWVVQTGLSLTGLHLFTVMSTALICVPITKEDVPIDV